ncbi:NAD(P)H-dependent oxidoreductase [Coprobacter sp.]
MKDKTIVLLLSHPDIFKSVANKMLLEVANSIPEIEVINLYDKDFDVDSQIKAIDKAAALIFQFPFYWASAPSQLKKWIDEVFTSIAKTEVVKNKPLLVVTTTASEYEAYRSGGRNKFTVDELLRPYQMLANHSGMIWQTPFVVYGMGTDEALQNLKSGVDEYRKRIKSLLD